MSISRVFNIQVAHGVAFNSTLQEIRPSMLIEGQTLRDIFKPVEELFENDRFYQQAGGITLSQQIDELRSMCIEAQSAHTTKDGCTKERRTQLVNVLQGILESVEEGYDDLDRYDLDMEFFSLPDLLDVVREDAMTYSEFLNNSSVSKTMFNIANNVEDSQKRLWFSEFSQMPTIDVADGYYVENLNVA